MSYTIETPKRLSPKDIEVAADLTALGFGREPDAHNLRDTTEHLNAADYI